MSIPIYCISLTCTLDLLLTWILCSLLTYAADICMSFSPMLRQSGLIEGVQCQQSITITGSAIPCLTAGDLSPLYTQEPRSLQARVIGVRMLRTFMLLTYSRALDTWPRTLWKKTGLLHLCSRVWCVCVSPCMRVTKEERISFLKLLSCTVRGRIRCHSWIGSTDAPDFSSNDSFWVPVSFSSQHNAGKQTTGLWICLIELELSLSPWTNAIVISQSRNVVFLNLFVHPSRARLHLRRWRSMREQQPPQNRAKRTRSTRAKTWPVVSAWTRCMRRPKWKRGGLAYCPTAVTHSAWDASLLGGRPKTSRRKWLSECLVLFIWWLRLCWKYCRLPFGDVISIYLFDLPRGCPQCRVKSAFYVPCKYWVEGKPKETVIASFKEKCR